MSWYVHGERLSLIQSRFLTFAMIKAEQESVGVNVAATAKRHSQKLQQWQWYSLLAYYSWSQSIGVAAKAASSQPHTRTWVLKNLG